MLISALLVTKVAKNLLQAITARPGVEGLIRRSCCANACGNGESVCCGTSAPVRWHSQDLVQRTSSLQGGLTQLVVHRSEYGHMPYVLDVQFFSTTIKKLSLVAGHASS